MSLLQTLFSKNPEQQEAPAPQQQQQQAPKVDDKEGNGTIPGIATLVPPTGNAEQDKTPLEEFGKLWQTDKQAGQEGAKPILEIKPEELTTVAGKMNFTGGLKPDDLAAIAAGGEESTAALNNILNQVAQTVFAQATTANAHLINTATNTGMQRVQDSMPEQLKTLQTSQELASQNPLYNNPAAQPMIQLVETQMRTQYPNATPEEVTKATNNYLTQFASAMIPQQQQQATVSPEEDFSSWS